MQHQRIAEQVSRMFLEKEQAQGNVFPMLEEMRSQLPHHTIRLASEAPYGDPADDPRYR